MRSSFVGPAIVLAALLASGPALAQSVNPAFEKGKADDVKDVKETEWTAKGEAGLVSTTGNSKSTTITLGINATRKTQENKLDAVLAGTFARATTRTATDANADGAIDAGELSSTSSTSAENAQLKLRFDRYITALDAFYVAGLAAVDRPAGKDFVGGGQAGYSRGLYKTDDQELLVELGYDLSYVNLAAAAATTIHSVRGFAGYKGKLNKQAALDASIEGLFNANRVTFGDRDAAAFKDVRLNGNIGITASLSSKLTLNAAFTARFDNFPAPLGKIGALPFAPGFEPIADKLDTTTKISLIVKFL
jgi:hypothetical protein